jgi:hypothetical protein
MPLPREQVLTMPTDDELRNFALARRLSIDEAKKRIEAQIDRRRAAFKEIDDTKAREDVKSD